MNAKELFNRLKEDRKLRALALVLACGAALLALSFLLTPPEETPTPHSADVEYAMAGLEARLAAVLSQIAGAGEVQVLVTEEDGGICGVLIVADGAQELTVRTELMRAAMTALDVPASSVEVFARNTQKGEEG